MDNENQPHAKQDVAPRQPATQLSRADKFRRVFFLTLISCLLGAAAVGVIAVLIGSFNDILGRALGTIAMVALHAAFSFSYVSGVEESNKKNGSRSIELFSNTVFVLIVASFITSVFAIWQLLGVNLATKFYLSYGVLLFATLHADILYRLRKFEKKIDIVVSVNYFLMSVVVAMLFMVIFSDDISEKGEFFYRLLAAISILDATSTISAIILHRLYLQKHPPLAKQAIEADSAKSKNFWKNPLVILLLIFLAFQIVGSFFAFLMNISS